MNKQTIVLIQNKIDALPDGVTFDLKNLMGNDWTTIPSKQSFGREFKKAVASGEVAGVIHDHLDNSPRRDIYRKAISNAR